MLTSKVIKKKPVAKKKPKVKKPVVAKKQPKGDGTLPSWM